MAHGDVPAADAAADRPADATDEEETVIRLRGPGDVVATLPYHLGYVPEDSLVVMALSGSRVEFVGRIDLPSRSREAWEAVDQIADPVLRLEPERILLVAYEPVDRAGRSELLSSRLADVFRGCGIEVADRIVVRGDRFWSPDCPPTCCPAEGSPVPADADVPAVADFVLLGRVPVARRADLDLLLAPDHDASARLDGIVELGHELVALTRRRSDSGGRSGGPGRVRGGGGGGSTPALGRGRRLADHRRRALTAWAAVLSGEAGVAAAPGRMIDPAAAVLLAASLRDVVLRDLLIGWLCPGWLELEVLDAELLALARELLPPPGETARRDDGIVARLGALCRATPSEVAAAPLTLLANVAWWHGDGALTRVALERALEHEPNYRLARLLQRMVDLAIRPHPAA